MNINKFTQNSLQAVQTCEKVAYEYGNQQTNPELRPDPEHDVAQLTARC